jgi:ElaB/YqjD/DUF883 family membrane-anchored ribosome-binding protein
METYHKNHEPFNLLNPEATPGNEGSTAENIMEKGTDAYDKAEQMVGDAYDKTTQKVSETYENAKIYSDENPGKTIFIALGIGVGLGLLLGAGSHHRSRTSRIAKPVVNALSDVALAFFR